MGQTLVLDVPAHVVDVVLGRPTLNTVTASVLTYQDAQVYLEWRGAEKTGRTPTQTLKAGQPTEFLISDLPPNAAFKLQTFVQTASDTAFKPALERSFHTARPAGETFTFDIQADSHLDGNSDLSVYARTLGNMTADSPDFLVDLGDTFMTDKYNPFKASEKQYLAQRYFFGSLAPSPLFLVLGNHDGESGAKSQEMSVWGANMRRQFFPNPVPDSFYTGNATPDKMLGHLQDYYAWTWGDATFFVLDAYWFTPKSGGGWGASLGKTQYDWLTHTLENSRSPYKFVFVHQLIGGLEKEGRGGISAAPFFEWGGKNADGSAGFANERPGWAMPIHDLLVKHGVSAVFHGHDHLFAKEDLDGIVYQEVPQPASARPDNTGSAASYGYTHGEVLGGPGHLRVKVAPAGVTVEYVRSLAGSKNAQVDYKYTIGRK